MSYEISFDWLKTWRIQIKWIKSFVEHTNACEWLFNNEMLILQFYNETLKAHWLQSNVQLFTEQSNLIGLFALYKYDKHTILLYTNKTIYYRILNLASYIEREWIWLDRTLIHQHIPILEIICLRSNRFGFSLIKSFHRFIRSPIKFSHVQTTTARPQTILVFDLISSTIQQILNFNMTFNKQTCCLLLGFYGNFQKALIAPNILWI